MNYVRYFLLTTYITWKISPVNLQYPLRRTLNNKPNIKAGELFIWYNLDFERYTENSMNDFIESAFNIHHIHGIVIQVNGYKTDNINEREENINY